MNEDLLNVMGNFVETELDYIENCEKEKLELEKQNTELKDNWNKLKEWLEEEYERCDKIGNPAIGCAMGQIKRTKNKMQEIEGGMNE